MAGSVIGALRVTLGIDTAAFENGLGIAQRRLNAVGKKFDRIGSRMQSVGKTMTLGITAPIVAFGVSSLKAAGDFETAMNRTAAVSGATAQELKSLSDLAKEMGRTTQFSASEAANALGFLAMAGFDAQEAMDALPGTLQLASSAQMELAETADLVSNVLSGYNMEVTDLARVNDVLVKTFTSTNTNLEMLGASMKFVGPVAASAGVRFEEAAAAIGLMGNAGIQGEMAGTALRGALSKILAPSKKAAGIMADLGLKFTDAEGRLIPLVEIVEQLGPHADDAGLFMQIFGQRAGPAMAALVGQGADALRDLDSELVNSGGTAERISKVQMEGFNGAMKRLKSAFEGLQIAVAESGLLDWIGNFVTRLSNLIQRVSEFSPAALRMGVILAGIAAAAGPLLVVAGSIVSAIGALAPVFAPVAALIGSAGLAGALGAAATAAAPFIAVGAALAGAWALFGDKVGPVLSTLKDRFNEVLGPKLQSLFATIKELLTRLWNGPFGEGIRKVIGWLGQLQASYLGVLGEGLLRILSALVSAVEGTFKLIGDVFTVFARLLTGDFAGAWEAYKDLVGNAVSALLNVVKALVPEIAGTIDDMVSAIYSTLSGMGGQMLEFGKNIVQGLVRGILAAPQAVSNALRKIVMAGVSNVKSILGINSPSRLFMEIGGFVTEGLAKGITDGSGKVELAMSKLAGKLPEQYAPSGGLGFPELENSDLGERAGSSIADALVEGLKGRNVFSALEDGFSSVLSDVAQRSLSSVESAIFGQGGIASALDSLFKNLFSGSSIGGASSGGGGLLNTIGGFLGGIFGGGRAGGGPVMANTPYVVGEDRPELFVPSTSGRIMPNLNQLNSNAQGGVMEVRLNDEMLEALIISGSARVVRQAAPEIVSAAVNETARELSRESL